MGQEVLEGHGIRHVSVVVQMYAHNSSNRSKILPFQCISAIQREALYKKE